MAHPIEPDITEISIPCKKEYVALSRIVAASIASCLPFTEEGVEDIRTAIGEACINSIMHAYKNENEITNYIFIRILVYPNKVVIVVKDTGTGFNPQFVQRYAKVSDVEEPDRMGLGLFLINSLMDEVEFDSTIGEGSQIRMVKYITN
ncbi:MAG: ATP-binding protein [bacterium]